MDQTNSANIVDDFYDIDNYDDFDGECCPVQHGVKMPLFLFEEDDWGTAYEMDGEQGPKFHNTCSDEHAVELATQRKWVDGKGGLNVILSNRAKRLSSMPSSQSAGWSQMRAHSDTATGTGDEETASKRSSSALDTSGGSTQGGSSPSKPILTPTRRRCGPPAEMQERWQRRSGKQSPSSSATSSIRSVHGRKQDRTSEAGLEGSRSEH